MSIQYEPAIPHWEYHRLAKKHGAAVIRIGRRYGFDRIESGEVGWRNALKLCLAGGIAVKSEKHLKNTFLRYCEFEFLANMDNHSRTIPISRIRKNTDDENTDETIIDRIAASTPPRQEEYTFFMQCLNALDELPKNQRRVMRKLALGHSVTEIAIAENRNVQEVLSEIRIAREWVNDFARNG